MARIRTVKPEFWTSEQVMELSRDARLLFVGMWNFCDDAGIHPASEKRLKAEVFPADDLTVADISRLIAELYATGLLDLYEIDGERYWIVTGWHHQKIDKATYKYPSPDGTLPNGSPQTLMKRRKSNRTRRALGDVSTNSRQPLAEASPPEGKGEERKGEEGSKPSSKEEMVGNPTHARIDGENQNVKHQQTRAVAIAVRLRHAGIRGANASNPHLIEWAENPLVTDDMLDAAVELAKERTDNPGPNYLAPIVKQLLNPPPPKRKPDDWHRTDPGIERKARELGVTPRAGETYPALKARLFDEIGRRERGNGAAA